MFGALDFHVVEDDVVLDQRLPPHVAGDGDPNGAATSRIEFLGSGFDQRREVVGVLTFR